MSFFTIDLDKYRKWTIQQLYYLLYPLIKDDFVGKQDHNAVHAAGNMIAGDSVVTYITIQPSSHTFADIKEREYAALAETGDASLASAQETGTTTTIQR